MEVLGSPQGLLEGTFPYWAPGQGKNLSSKRLGEAEASIMPHHKAVPTYALGFGATEEVGN